MIIESAKHPDVPPRPPPTLKHPQMPRRIRRHRRCQQWHPLPGRKWPPHRACPSQWRRMAHQRAGGAGDGWGMGWDETDRLFNMVGVLKYYTGII